MVRDEAILAPDGAHLVPALAAAHLAAPLRVGGPRRALLPGLEEPCSQHTQRRVTVAVLAALGLAADGEARGQVRENDGTLRLVAVLAPGPAAAARAPLQLGRRNHERGVLGLLEDGHRHRAGVHAAALLVGRNPLPAVASRLVLEDAGRIHPRGPEDDETWALLEHLETKGPSVPPASYRGSTALARGAGRRRPPRPPGVPR